MKFNTVQEVITWKNFSLDNNIYDLSHLNAHQVEYLDHRDEDNPITYRFIVTYGLHCFTKDAEILSQEQSKLLMYYAPRECRPFHFERYELSKQLPSIIQSLGQKETLVCHAGYGKFAVVKIVDGQGNNINYFVPFAVFKESKKLRLHVQSAYPSNDIGRIKKVNFFAIAKNLLNNKKLPKP
ncbi:MAG: heat-shock protein [Alkalinema sp. RU_4_3]|nr:heat-shock protein [Alkalinema sp. RU_4_3]